MTPPPVPRPRRWADPRWTAALAVLLTLAVGGLSLRGRGASVSSGGLLVLLETSEPVGGEGAASLELEPSTRSRRRTVPLPPTPPSSGPTWTRTAHAPPGQAGCQHGHSRRIVERLLI